MTEAAGVENAKAWLVVIDMQRIFAGPPDDWATPGYARVSEKIRALIPLFGRRVAFTRFVAPENPQGSWVPYYRQWSFALVPPNDPLYDITAEFETAGHPVVSRTTFGKWGAELARATEGTDEIVLAGVSTDCCVISTALPAADAGIHVRVVADACAGVSEADHERALRAMSLYAPMIETTTVEQVLAEGA
ncbi:MAG TPA: cysteine hydrolase [Microbacteriaceae bacterium]|nr:cysteine hydrolase [Microbacteriaceae bacterium]